MPAFGFLNAVAATSAKNAWAVGGTNGGRTLIVHWNGTNWTQLPRANRGGLNGVSATSATNAWAVGAIEVRRDIYKILILQWNGTTWKRR